MSRSSSTPDKKIVTVRALNFQYPGTASPIFEHLDVHFEKGFTGVVGANGSGKSTLLDLLSGALKPESGQIKGADNLVHCAQRTDEPPALLGEFLDDPNGATYALRGRLGIEWDFLEKWQTLSHGERKRAQIATALWQAPNVLTIDEPTNHIDSEARSILVQSLKQFTGIGIIVSHDRELLDELCDQTLWLEASQASRFSGGYSKAKDQRSSDRDSLIKDRDIAKKNQKRLDTEINKRREKASRADKDRSKAGIDRKDHDAKTKIDAARLTGKDGTAGRLMNQLAGRKSQLDSQLASLNVTKQRQVGIWLDGSKTSRRNLLEMPAQQLALGEALDFDEQRHLAIPHLLLQPDSRVALTGANGSGKSTLLNAVLDHVNVPTDRLIYMPQEISAQQSQEILREARTYSNEALGHLMTIVSCLGSDPKRILQSDQPSPGEVRKLLLALGMAKQPWLIIMDEPTNHLDLPSIEALEEALSDCPCGLLLVSHDESFLESLTTQNWHIERVNNDQTSSEDSLLVIR